MSLSPPLTIITYLHVYSDSHEVLLSKLAITKYLFDTKLSLWPNNNNNTYLWWLGPETLWNIIAIISSC